METIVSAAITALIVSAIYGKASAVHTFNVIDGYVKDMIELIEKSITDT